MTRRKTTPSRREMAAKRQRWAFERTKRDLFAALLAAGKSPAEATDRVVRIVAWGRS